MGRSGKNSTRVNNEDISKIDFKTIKTTNISDTTEIIVRNSNGEAGKTTIEEILTPVNKKIEDLTEVVASKADKCFAIAMAIVL